jgi:hypothetical protein
LPEGAAANLRLNLSLPGTPADHVEGIFAIQWPL